MSKNSPRPLTARRYRRAGLAHVPLREDPEILPDDDEDLGSAHDDQAASQIASYVYRETG
jgi:hypothetical protein